MDEDDDRLFEEYSLLEKLQWLVYDQLQDISVASKKEIVETLEEVIDEISTT